MKSSQLLSAISTNEVACEDFFSSVSSLSDFCFLGSSALGNFAASIQFLTAEDPSAKNRSLKSVFFSDLLPSDQTGIASLEFVEIAVSLACLIPGLPSVSQSSSAAMINSESGCNCLSSSAAPLRFPQLNATWTHMPVDS